MAQNLFVLGDGVISREIPKHDHIAASLRSMPYPFPAQGLKLTQMQPDAISPGGPKQLTMRQDHQHCCFGITFAVNASVIKSPLQSLATSPPDSERKAIGLETGFGRDALIDPRVRQVAHLASREKRRSCTSRSAKV
jgi:hypothetical protein